MDDGELGYPAHWEADVVLRDGGTAHLRPILPERRGPAAPLPRPAVRRDHLQPVLLALPRACPTATSSGSPWSTTATGSRSIATVGDEMIGVVRYERTGPDEAEVAFNIEDAHQGRGLGSVFLEHIAAAARERGIARFVADVLPHNRKMLRVFSDAGYVVDQEFDDGVVRLAFDLEPTEDSLAVTLRPRAPGRGPLGRSGCCSRSRWSSSVPAAARTSLGRVVLQHMLDGGLHRHGARREPEADEVGVAGLPSYRSVRDVPGAGRPRRRRGPGRRRSRRSSRTARPRACAALVVVSAGFAETGAEGAERAAAARRAGPGQRHAGGRARRPSGVINTDPDGLAERVAVAASSRRAGRLGFFSQSGALGVALLDNAVRRGLGISTFVSAGNRVDVSGNDLLQFWEEDDATDAVMLYLESLGNPRKFSRIARRLARRKPVVVVKSGRFRGDAPHGHLVRESRAPAAAVDALFRRAGVIRADSIHQMFDVAALVATQPLPDGPPGGRRRQLRRARRAGRGRVRGGRARGRGQPRDLGPDASAEDFAAALAEVFADPDVDSVVALFIPPLRTRDTEVAERPRRGVGARRARRSCRRSSACRGVPDALRAPGGEAAARCRRTPRPRTPSARSPPSPRTPPGGPRRPGTPCRPSRARRARGPRPGRAGCSAGRDEVTPRRRRAAAGCSRCYGIELWAEPARRRRRTRPSRPPGPLGYPVALKATAAHLRHRRELGGVRLDIDDAERDARRLRRDGEPAR